MATRPSKRVFTSQVAPIFLRRIRRLGADPAPFIARYGLPADAEGAGSIELPVATFRDFCDDVSRSLRDPYFGLHTALELERGAYGLLEFAGRAAMTLREGLETVVRFSRLLNDAVRFSFEVRDGAGIFDHRMVGDPACVGRQANEYTVAYLVRIARELLGKPWTPSQIWFAHPEPSDTEPLRAHLGSAALSFDTGANGFRVEGAWLDAPLLSADAVLGNVLRSQAQRILPEEPPADEVEHIRRKLHEVLPQGGAILERLASSLHMSPRTLQRRLREQGTSFQALLDAEREQLARKLLSDPKLGLAEVAFRLGYSELPVFVRSFKRWTGMTPGKFRAQR